MLESPSTPTTFYFPWTANDSRTKGIARARSLARVIGTTPVFVRADKNHLEDDLKGEVVITPRSGGTTAGRLLVALQPSMRMMTRFFRGNTPFMVIDSPLNPLRIWAELTGALDVATGTRMHDARSEDVSEIHRHITEDGYNGFTSPPASHVLPHYLSELQRQGWLDERGIAYLLASQMSTASDTGLMDLEKAARRI